MPSKSEESTGDALVTLLKEERRFAPPTAFSERAHVSLREEYDKLYRESLEEPDAFWRRETQDLVFHERWTKVLDWRAPHASWFVGARLNVSESCLDRHVSGSRKNKAALIWEAETGEVVTLTYAQLLREVAALTRGLRSLGVASGDRIAIYMGMHPSSVVAMLACARIGAVHTVVFGGFAPEALRDRIADSGAKVVLTQDGAFRRGKVVPLKRMVDEALAGEGTSSVEHVVVLRRLRDSSHPDAAVTMLPGRDHDWAELCAASSDASDAPAVVDAEHPLFILYTSGSTGRPKGVLHTSAGYLAGAHVSSKYVFDLRDDDIYWCTADVGWVTGHSYLVYGPLSVGATCMLYEGAPNFPDWGRFWSIVERHGVTILYTAPTAIRAFMRAGREWPDRHDLSSLRLLGSVGEPINPEAWIWYRDAIGGNRCPIVDTWWQTETGSIMLVTLPGAVDAKPGSTGLPFFGVEPAIVDKHGNAVPNGSGGLLVLRRPWPSMLRTVWGDDERFRRQYFGEIEGVYFTGDGARRDADGYHWVVGRIDDVLNVAGHRIGTAEIESALVSHPVVVEAAAVGRPDELKGQALVVFVTVRQGHEVSARLGEELAEHVGNGLGKFARPDVVRFTDALPKTRSGKIMRRLLKDVAAGKESTGDMSTLEDFSVLARLRSEEE
ncbi:MAG: acetate--CoA ligase [Deltaproteobacteria bacterium]|nr:acetate--CoA ligase [Deltaproteobacteria bacterium]